MAGSAGKLNQENLTKKAGNREDEAREAAFKEKQEELEKLEADVEAYHEPDDEAKLEALKEELEKIAESLRPNRKARRQPKIDLQSLLNAAGQRAVRDANKKARRRAKDKARRRSEASDKIRQAKAKDKRQKTKPKPKVHERGTRGMNAGAK